MYASLGSFPTSFYPCCVWIPVVHVCVRVRSFARSYACVFWCLHMAFIGIKGQRECVRTNPLFAHPFFFISFFTLLPCCRVGCCVLFFLPLCLAFGLGWFLLCMSKLVLSLPLSACWLAQVSLSPRMPLHPQQPRAFGLQLPETVPELLCLCSHTHLHWYEVAGTEVNVGVNEVVGVRKRSYW